MFCKRDLINDYIREANLHKCDMDGDVILDVGKEGQDCSWFKEKRDMDNKLFHILLIACGVALSIVFVGLCLVLSMAAFAGSQL